MTTDGHLISMITRLGSTTANGHGTVTEDGLFQFGHRKDHRPDLPQVKVMVSALDPLDLPMATDVVPGQRANDPLYIPAITRMREGLGRCGLLQMQYEAEAHQRPVRRYGDRPATVQVEHHLQVTASVVQKAVAAAVRQLAWLVYATKQPADQFPLEQAVPAFRDQYRVERDMGRLKGGHPLSLTPMSLQRGDRTTGLIGLLSVGLRVLTLLKFVVRQRLTAQRTVLIGLYGGNPKRTTARPTSERLLECSQGLTLTIIRESRRRRSHLTPLSRVQQRILALLDFSVDFYLRLCPDSHKPP
jgi:transposase